ncbi:hypothetical protein LEN26_006367 [Aphanomyces euteiches]|nr:hypothetical protein AeMF1_003228 [Aphanomyces euteiches]KAH9135675.1 hypothetical protein LEN26_006367 [Aphanomyces euteiches]KAH9193606.1 hypothetical protein AeNC1_004408 [Aphanomyces euteiches]
MTDSKKERHCLQTNEENKVKRLLADVMTLWQFENKGTPHKDVGKIKRNGNWNGLLDRFLEQEEYIISNPHLFSNRNTMKKNLARAAELLRDWKPHNQRSLADDYTVKRHANQVVHDLLVTPNAPHLPSTAWTAFGGICSNLFAGMRPDFGQNATLWVNKPLPALPHGREIAANWITSNMFSQIDMLMEHCLTPYTPNADCKTIQIPCQSSDLCQEEVSDVHLVHLRRQKSYHVTKYRQHAILLPFETAMKVAKGRYEKNIRGNPPRQVFKTSDPRNPIALLKVGSKYAKRVSGPNQQHILMRQFEEHNLYCALACCITSDECYPGADDATTKEWTSWTIVKARPDGNSTLIQIAVTTGLQRNGGPFMPYDNYPIDSMSDPNVQFDELIKNLRVHYTQEFAKDADRNSLRVVDLYRDFELPIEEQLCDAILNPTFLQPPATPISHRTPEPSDVTSPAASEDEDDRGHKRPRQESVGTDVDDEVESKRVMRDERGDVFAAVTYLHQNYYGKFSDDDLARVVTYMTKNSMSPTAFLALSPVPSLQAAWLRQRIAERP